MTDAPMPDGLVGLAAADRVVLQMAGSDARSVLQDIVTNNIDLVVPGVAIYSALLTPQGKYLFDFFLLDGSDGAILIDVARDRAQDLARRLQMYGLRRDVALSARNDLPVTLAWGTSDAPDADMVVADPRDPGLGWRIYGAAPDIAAATRADYDALRITRSVPESGIELQPEQTFILEAGFERLHGVDFRKGCYVGQEVTARMKHKTELRKGLVKVAVDGQADPGTPITADGKPAGTLFSTHNGVGLAHLRLDRAGPDMQAGEATVTYAPD